MVGTYVALLSFLVALERRNGSISNADLLLRLNVGRVNICGIYRMCHAWCYVKEAELDRKEAVN